MRGTSSHAGYLGLCGVPQIVLESFHWLARAALLPFLFFPQTKIFSYWGVAPRQLSILGWRTLTSLYVLWLEVLRHDIFIRELRGLYQFKKPKGFAITYFSAWGDHDHIVEGDPALKKGYRKEWFVAEGGWET